jgi:dephospho-CoA kinase
MGPGSPLAAELRAAFGDGVVRADGSIDRPALGKLVFSDPAALARLEEIVWPPVIAHKLARIHEPGPDVLVLDAIKLFEAGMAAHCDEVWVTDSTCEQQIARIMQRNRVDRAEAERRIDAQPPQAEKLAKADVVIDNSGSIEQTREQILREWRRLTADE